MFHATLRTDTAATRVFTLVGVLALLVSACEFREKIVPTQSDGQLLIEATLLAKSPGAVVQCGFLYVHELAKYRVVRVIDGHYGQAEVIVDHPSCGIDALKGIEVGDLVRLTLKVTRDYPDATFYPGIRTYDELKSSEFIYVGSELPVRLSRS